jgi:Zn-dependent M16 (insulinase) family peptidase
MLTPEAWLSELVFGMPQLKLNDELAAGFEEKSDRLAARIEQIRDFLLVRGRLTASFTGSDRAYALVRNRISDWAGRMRDETVQAAPTGFTASDGLLREGLAGPVDIGHCAQALPAPHASDSMEPYLALGARIVSLDYMLNEIRFKGNAYGAWFQYSPLGSSFNLGSYNDPNIVRTLGVFEGVLDHVKNAEWSKEDLDRAIIGTAKHDERPIRPGSATGIALDRHLIGNTRERRCARHAKILAATPRLVKDALVSALESCIGKGTTCVVAARETLEEVNRQMPDATLDIRDIL